jgi:phosphoglycerate dehydrogenase-like enzyme
MKVLVVNKGLAKRIKRRLPEEFEVITPVEGNDEELIKLASDVDVILSTRLSPEVAFAATNLKLLQKTGAGVDDMPIDALKPGAWIANTSGANPVPLAEGAVALVFALAKRVVQKHICFREGRGTFRGILLKGKNAGIIGLGNIGTEVAKRLKALGMNVLAIKRNLEPQLKETLGLDYIGSKDDLDYVLRESDFIVITVPLTPETRGLIGEKELRLMKPTSYIINVARAAIIQEEPLYRALSENWIAGAAIDVWWKPHWWDPLWNPEGLDASLFPFWELPNVICTGHNIGSSDSLSEVSLDIMVDNILRIRDGKSPKNIVDKNLKY